MSTSTETIVVPFKVTVWNSDPENPDNVIVGHEKLFLDVLDDKVQALNMDGWRTNPEADSEYQSGDTTLFVDQYEKDRHVVLLLNEHELCHIGCVTLTFFSNSRVFYLNKIWRKLILKYGKIKLSVPSRTLTSSFAFTRLANMVENSPHGLNFLKKKRRTMLSYCWILTKNPSLRKNWSATTPS